MFLSLLNMQKRCNLDFGSSISTGVADRLESVVVTAWCSRTFFGSKGSGSSKFLEAVGTGVSTFAVGVCWLSSSIALLNWNSKSCWNVSCSNWLSTVSKSFSGKGFSAFLMGFQSWISLPILVQNKNMARKNVLYYTSISDDFIVYNNHEWLVFKNSESRELNSIQLNSSKNMAFRRNPRRNKI